MEQAGLNKMKELNADLDDMRYLMMKNYRKKIEKYFLN